MVSDRNQPGFGPAFWAGIALAIPAYEERALQPCSEVPRPRAPRRDWLRGLVSTVAHRYARARQRRAAKEWNDHMLRDLGLTRAELGAETQDPLWRA